MSELSSSNASPQSLFGPSQKDIAKALGIAQTTVALALNPKYQDRFAASTVEMITQKANEMGYRPKRFAQIMRGGRSRMIGILSVSEYHQINRTQLGCIINEVLERGFTPITACTRWFKGDVEKTVNYLRDQMVEGIIAVNLGAAIRLPASIDSMPKISFSELASEPGEAIFNCDIEWAFRELTRHHLSTGSRHLLLLLNQRDKELNKVRGLEGTLGARIAAFVEVIREAGGSIEGEVAGLDVNGLLGLPPRPKRLPAGTIRGRILAPVWQWSGPMEVGFQMGRQLLAGPRRSRPDSILGSNDAIALGVMRAAKQLGIDIPGELRLSGYDDDETSQYLLPSLTSVEIPLHEIVAEAVTELLDQIENRGRKRTVLIKPRLVIRESTVASAPIPG